MNFDDIRGALETPRPPDEALRGAITHADTLAPAVLALIEKMIAGVQLAPAQDNLLFYGIHVLAAARRTALCQSLLRMLRLPDDQAGEMLGDAASASLPGILISVFDGDSAPLIAAIADRAIDSHIRQSLMGALGRLTFDGAVARADAVELIDRFDRERLADDGDLAWKAWQDMIRLLALADRRAMAQASWQDGRVTSDSESDRAAWEDRFAAACADPGNPQRFVDHGLVPIDDPVAALAWQQFPEDTLRPGAEEGPPRRDVARAIALGPPEVYWLARFLRSVHMPAEPKSFEQLDGFLTALAVGPGQVSDAEAMGAFCGAEDRTGPRYDSAEQAQYVDGLLRRYRATIALRLNAGYPHSLYVRQRGDGLDGAEWAAGFVSGMALDSKAWDPLVKRGQQSRLLRPIMALFISGLADEDGVAKLPQRTREGCIAVLPATVLEIHRFWHAPRPDPAAAPQPARKVGRNEPCPCGSGKKYKRCCAAGVLPGGLPR